MENEIENHGPVKNLVKKSGREKNETKLNYILPLCAALVCSVSSASLFRSRIKNSRNFSRRLFRIPQYYRGHSFCLDLVVPPTDRVHRNLNFQQPPTLLILFVLICLRLYPAQLMLTTRTFSRRPSIFPNHTFICSACFRIFSQKPPSASFLASPRLPEFPRPYFLFLFLFLFLIFLLFLLEAISSLFLHSTPRPRHRNLLSLSSSRLPVRYS